MNQNLSGISNNSYSSNNINNNGKNKKGSAIVKAIVIVIILLILLIIIGLILFFTTDLLKSDKQMFISNLTKFSDDSYNKYNETKDNLLYKSNEGSLEIDLTVEGQDINSHADILFEGSENSDEDVLEQKITYSYADGIETEYMYVRNNNFVGIQNDYISKNYITIDADSVETIETTGIISTIKQIVNLDRTQDSINSEQIDGIINIAVIKYLPELYNSFSNDQFSKNVREDGKTEYILKTNNKQLLEISINLAHRLKEDVSALEDFGITTEKIDEYILEMTEINETEISEEELMNIEFISCYDNGSNYMTIVLSQDTSNIMVRFIDTSSEERISNIVEIIVKDNNVENFNLLFEANIDIINLKEEYKIGFTTEMINLDINYNNAITEEESVSILELKEDNTINLEDMSIQKNDKFISDVTERLSDVSELKIEEVEDETGEEYISPFSIFSILTFMMGSSLVF